MNNIAPAPEGADDGPVTAEHPGRTVVCETCVEGILWLLRIAYTIPIVPAMAKMKIASRRLTLRVFVLGGSFASHGARMETALSLVMV